MKPTLVVTSDFTKNFNDIVKRFKKDDVLVGIPEDDTTRKDGDPINNATILAINNFGSPANNIPAWPVMEIGIRNAQDAITDQFKQAAIGALSKGLSALSPAYNRAGSIAANSIKKVINSQEQAPDLAPGTLAARKSKGFAGTKRLVVSGQLRNAITWVLRGEE